MFKVTKNIWIFGLFKKCTFMEHPRKKKGGLELWKASALCSCAGLKLQLRSPALLVEPHWSHTATQNTPATVSVRDSDHSHTSSVRLMENSRMTHMTWRHQRGIVTPVIVSTRGGELVIADLSLLFKGRMVSSVTQRSLLGPSEWPTGHQLQGEHWLWPEESQWASECLWPDPSIFAGQLIVSIMVDVFRI